MCQTFEQQIVNGSERLNKITDFFEGHEGEQIDFKAVSFFKISPIFWMSVKK